MATTSPQWFASVDQLWAAVQPRKGFFDAFRTGQHPALYPAQYTPVGADVLVSGLIFAGVILAFSLLLVLPGRRRHPVSLNKWSIRSHN